MQLTKVLICVRDTQVYSFAYAQNKLVFVTTDELNSISSEAIFRAKVCKVNHANQTAFIEYLPNATGYINLPSQVKVQNGTIIPVQLSWLGNEHKQAKFRYNWQLVGKYLVYAGASNSVKIVSAGVSSQVLAFLNKLLENHPAEWILRSALSVDTEVDAVIAEAKILCERAKTIESRLNLYTLDIGMPNYCKLLRSFSLAKDAEIIINNESIYDEVTEWQDAWMLDVITYDKHYEIDDLITWYQDMLTNPLIELANGGSLEISTVSGINIIDVNSGSLAVAVDKLNLMFITDIYHNICLRNLQGIILIDFVKNMQQDAKRKIIDEFNKLFHYDVVRTQILGFSNAGLLELIRNKF